MTRDTFIGGNGSRLFQAKKHDQSFFSAPPTQREQRHLLTTLRYLMIQNWDLDDEGQPETLRLLDAIPPQWGPRFEWSKPRLYSAS